jgi:hypothetical protein
MTLEKLEKEIKVLKDRIRNLEDIEAIKKLQRAYGYYLEHWMGEDLIDLFADGPDSALEIAAGKFVGKESIRHFFHHGKEIEIPHAPNPKFLHQVMQLCGVVHVDPEGKTAKGRWYGFGAHYGFEKGGPAGWMNGVYEVDYIKQNDMWKMKKVRWMMTFRAPWTDGFTDTPSPYNQTKELKATSAPDNTLFPSGFVAPFHFSNPVSGRKTFPQK